MGQNDQPSNSSLTQKTDEAMAEKPAGAGSRPVQKAPPHKTQDQPTIEEFGEEGMGIAAKE